MNELRLLLIWPSGDQHRYIDNLSSIQRHYINQLDRSNRYPDPAVCQQLQLHARVMGGKNGKNIIIERNTGFNLIQLDLEKVNRRPKSGHRNPSGYTSNESEDRNRIFHRKYANYFTVSCTIVLSPVAQTE